MFLSKKIKERFLIKFMSLVFNVPGNSSIDTLFSSAGTSTSSKNNKNNWKQTNKAKMQLSGFTQMDNALFREIANNIDISAAGVYFILLSHRNTITNKCFPTYSTLKKECNTSVSYISKAINLLIKFNYIHTIPGNSHVATQYFFPKESFYKKEEDLSLNIKAKEKNIKEKEKDNSNKKSTKQNKSDKQNKSTNSDNKNSIDEELERAFDGLPD